MNYTPIRNFWIIGLLVASVSGATNKTAVATAPQIPAEEVPPTTADSAVDSSSDTESSQDNEEGEEDSETDTASEGDIFGNAERGELNDPNWVVRKGRADEYFRRGTLLYDGGDYASAAQAFLVAYETLPHQAVLGNIALCFDKAGKIPEAVVYYRRYLVKPVGSEKDEYMASRLAELETLVGEMTVSCLDDGCEIRVDGISRGKEKATVVLMPGEHRVESYEGEVPIDSRMVEINAREKQTLSLGGEDPTPVKKTVLIPPPIQQIPAVSSPTRLSIGFWVAASTTVVSAAALIAFGTMVLKTKSDFDKASDKNEDPKASLQKKGQRYVNVTNIMVGVTSAAALTSIMLAYWDLRGRNKNKKLNATITTGTSELGIGIEVSF